MRRRGWTDDGIRRVAFPRDAEASRRYREHALAASPTGRAAEPAPVVLVPACAPSGAQLPRGAAALIRTAIESGWRVRATYALAEIPAWRRQLATMARDGAHWRDIPAEMVESVAVRLACPTARGFAVWRNRSWDCAWLVIGDRCTRFGARALSESVRSTIVESSLVRT